MRIWFSMASLLAISCLQSCAPSLKGFDFEKTSPLFAKNIGVFYERKLIGNFEGLDERDSQEYLTALCAALERYSNNAKFIDMTQAGVRISSYKPYTVKKTGLMGDTASVDYLVPENGSLSEFGDSLDFVILLQNISVMRDVPIEIAEGNAFPNMDPFQKRSSGSFIPMSIFRVVETEKQIVTHLGYLIWDFKKNEAIGYEGKSLNKQMFMDKSTTFVQDAELTSQRLLKELRDAFRNGKSKELNAASRSRHQQ